MAMLCPGVWPDLPHLQVPHANGRSSPPCRSICVWVALSSPHHHQPAETQQWGRVLDNDVERSERTRGHQVVPAEAIGPRLCSVVHYLDVRQAAGDHSPLKERTLARDSLKQCESRFGKRNRKRQAGEARP